LVLRVRNHGRDYLAPKTSCTHAPSACLLPSLRLTCVVCVLCGSVVCCDLPSSVVVPCGVLLSVVVSCGVMWSVVVCCVVLWLHQVDSLIKEATCVENLCQLFVGWCAFW
jgi:hypothetical protein